MTSIVSPYFLIFSCPVLAIALGPLTGNGSSLPTGSTLRCARTEMAFKYRFDVYGGSRCIRRRTHANGMHNMAF
ncbi:hypothetical protein EDD15DRAFT_2284133 [Pisolithus albus]|nr:hypothetical protein EDD15DRAFT_2284133 [Pisolithus albus]